MTDAEPAGRSAINKSVRVLIADDSSAIRTSLSALVSRVPGVDIVGVAQTGSKTIELIRALRPDVVTLDIRMPDLNGLKVLQEIRNDDPRPMMIVLTGLSGDEYRQKCLELGAKHFFHKSSEFEKVLDILQGMTK